MRILVIVVILVVLLAMWLYGRAVDELDSLPGDDLGSWDD